MKQTCTAYAIGSSYVWEVYESLLRLDWDVFAWVANQPGQAPEGLERVVSADSMTEEQLRLHPIVVPLVTPGHRRNIELELSKLGVTQFATVIDPTTVVAATARIEEGVYVNGAGIIGAKAVLERWANLNRSVSIGHDSIVREYAALGPGSLLCAFCDVGRGAFVGARAVVHPKVRIGANAVVSAGAVVKRDVPANSIVAGSPARIVKRGIRGYSGLGV